VADQLVDGGAEVLAGDDGTYATAEGRSQVGRLRQQLERHPCRRAVVQLAHDPHARVAGKRRRQRKVAGLRRLIGGPGAVGGRGEPSAVDEGADEPVVGEPFGADEPAGPLGKLHRLHVGDLRG
jgi:hypothetical protein